ncbi:hypothetical protein [Bordetella sp. LUAb4]|uniref:hypothetical protein n=1 Tax=Bordetella sp. LUAb4 TaxID=2843195 RepID=UPI001E417461|nr:hypothetical protein [Bordetella sp. LUAb4]
MATLLPSPGLELPAHRLIIVEGIMSSGKSTTMRFVAKNLEDAGLILRNTAAPLTVFRNPG